MRPIKQAQGEPVAHHPVSECEAACAPSFDLDLGHGGVAQWCGEIWIARIAIGGLKWRQPKLDMNK